MGRLILATVTLTLALLVTLASSLDPQCQFGLTPISNCLKTIKPGVYRSYFYLPNYNFQLDELLEQCKDRSDLDEAHQCVDKHRARCANGHLTLGYMDLLVNSFRFHEALCDQRGNLYIRCLRLLKPQSIRDCGKEKVAASGVSPNQNKQCAIAEASVLCAVDELEKCDKNTASFFRNQRKNVLPISCPR